MSHATPANLTSTKRPLLPTPGTHRRAQNAVALWWQAASASLRAMVMERFYLAGVGGGMLLLAVLPFMQVATYALLYGRSSDLFRYAAVGMIASAIVFQTAFWVGEILDRERVKGTLVPLFLAPCPRSAWLTGFILSGLVEISVVAGTSWLAAWLVFGVAFNVNVLTLVVIVPLFISALWGLGIICSGIGLLVKKANPFANLVWSAFSLLGGIFVPIDRLPRWLEIPAHALPIGYGIQALADASLNHASLRDVAPNLVPLAAFAVAMPLLGVLTFSWLERLIRVRGELDVY